MRCSPYNTENLVVDLMQKQKEKKERKKERQEKKKHKNQFPSINWRWDKLGEDFPSPPVGRKLTDLYVLRSSKVRNERSMRACMHAQRGILFFFWFIIPVLGNLRKKGSVPLNVIRGIECRNLKAIIGGVICMWSSSRNGKLQRGGTSGGMGIKLAYFPHGVGLRCVGLDWVETGFGKILPDPVTLRRKWPFVRVY